MMEKIVGTPFNVLSISKLSPSVFGVHRILSSDITRPPIL